MVFEISSPLFAFLVYYILAMYTGFRSWCLKFQVPCFPCCCRLLLVSGVRSYLWKITKGRLTFMLVDFLSPFCLILERTEFYTSFCLICKCTDHFSVIDHFQIHNILILNVKMYGMALRFKVSH